MTWCFRRVAAAREAGSPEERRVRVVEIERCDVTAIGGVDPAVGHVGQVAPAAGALGLVGSDGRGAGVTTDRRESHVVERVLHRGGMRHEVLVDVLGGRGDEIPGAHPAAARVLPITDLAAFVRETVDDGCIGETIGALEAKEGAHAAEAPVLARAYQTIADDEACHAALAFRIVQWAVGVDPSMRAVVVLALDAAEARAARVDGIRGAVRPCIEAILG